MKRFFALLLSAALLMGGCAAADNSAVVSEDVTSGVVSENIQDSPVPSDKGERTSTALVNSDNASVGSGAETSVPQSSDNSVDREDMSESVVLPESKPENTANSNSSQASAESTAATESDGASDSSVPPKTDSMPSASTKIPEESTTSSAAATPASVPDTASPEAAEEVPAEKTNDSAEGFYVSGTKLYDANGSEFVMRGINHPHNWFKNQDETALAAIAKTGANCVRIVCSDGQQYTKDSADTLSQLVERCKALEMIAILEVHDITGKDDLSALERTVDYWIEVKDALIGNEAYVILNIANEWVGTWESDTWTKGYTAAIPRLREAGIKNTIIVDAAGWGQYAKSISDGGEEVFESDPLKNTMFSIHMYGSAGKNYRVIKQNLARVTEKGLCVIVGEFGHTHSDGDVDEMFIMKYCGENDIGYLGWSWKGNGGGVEYLDIALEWDGSVLSEDWGKNLIEGDTGIRKTSEKCSVFK